MVDLYVSWSKGLPESAEALRILRDSGVVAGVEMSNIGPEVERIKDAGLKFSSHTPGQDLTLNLASPRTLQAFREQGDRLLEVIGLSDPSVVGFHLGYSAREVVKMSAFPNIPTPGTIITDPDMLLGILVETIMGIEQRINGILIPREDRKTVILETMDYSREGQEVPWDSQRDDIKARRSELEEVVETYGVNAALLHVTDVDFVDEVLRKTEPADVGFLFDIAHVFISADSRTYKAPPPKTLERHFKQMLVAFEGITYQLHVNVPGGNKDEGYKDHHRPFGDDELSGIVMELTREVYRETKDKLVLITLEMRTNTDNPVDHARIMVSQAENFIKKLEASA